MSQPTAFQRKLATIALQQYEKYHLVREQQSPLSGQIEKYWTDLGFSFPGVKMAWSAVFVSWCVKQAGASKEQFRFAAAYAKFVYQALQNVQGEVGVFRGRQVNAYSPKLGDIIQNNRSNHNYDYDYASTHGKSDKGSCESHSAIVVEVGSDNIGRYLRTIV